MDGNEPDGTGFERWGAADIAHKALMVTYKRPTVRQAVLWGFMTGERHERENPAVVSRQSEAERMALDRFAMAIAEVDALRQDFWALPQEERVPVWERFRKASDRRQDAEEALERLLLARLRAAAAPTNGEA